MNIIPAMVRQRNFINGMMDEHLAKLSVKKIEHDVHVMMCRESIYVNLASLHNRLAAWLRHYTHKDKPKDE